METIQVRDMRMLLEYQEKIDASAERGVALINCGESAQDAFDDLYKTISELVGMPAEIMQNAAAKIHDAKINKDRIDARRYRELQWQQKSRLD